MKQFPILRAHKFWASTTKNLFVPKTWHPPDVPWKSKN